jgi:hypothetical protein
MHLKQRTLVRVVGHGLIAVIIALVLVWAARLGPKTERITIRSQQNSSNVQYTRAYASPAIETATGAAAVDKWRFGRGLPRTWSTVRGARSTPRDGELQVVTTQATGVQVRSPVLRLRRGHYQALVKGRVESGGLYLGVDQMDPRGCKAAAYFDPTSTTRRRLWLPINFSTNGQPLRITIGNWAATPRSSLWRLREIRIINRTNAVRSAATAKRYASLASPLVSELRLVNFRPLLKWSFGYRVPSDWYATPGVAANKAESRPAYVVRTTSGRYDYVFNRLIRLPPGEYFLRFNGKILKGGLSIGVEDMVRRKWIAQRFYSYLQSSDEGVMATRFYLRRKRTVKLVLGNWSVFPGRSKWLIHRIELDGRL